MSLDTLMLLLVVAATIAMLIGGLASRDGVYQFPFLAATVCLGWTLPPAIGLCNSNLIPKGSYSASMWVVFLCLIAIFIAQKITLRPRPVNSLEYDENKLMLGSAGLTLFGAFFAIKIASMPEIEVAAGGGWTGAATIYLFFAHAQYFGFAIAILLLLRTFTWRLFFIVAFNFFFFVTTIILGRRGPIMEVGLIVLTALWFQRRIALPRWQIITAFVLVTLLFNSIGAYRSILATNEGALPSWEQLGSIDYLGTLNGFTEDGSEEFKNTVYFISAKMDTGNYNLGAGYWNDLVFRFVPGQLVGVDLKQSLMVPLDDDAFNVFFYHGNAGMNSSGFYDSFAEFWYFGALMFFVICMMMRRYYQLAMAGEFRAKLLYGLLMAQAMESITHSTAWFFSYVPQVFLFVLPVLAIARVRAGKTLCLNLPADPAKSVRGTGHRGQPRMRWVP